MKKLVTLLIPNLLLLISSGVHAAADLDDVTMEMMDLDDKSSHSLTRTIEIPSNDDRSEHDRYDDDLHDVTDDKDDDRDDDKDNDDSDDSIDDDQINDNDKDNDEQYNPATIED